MSSWQLLRHLIGFWRAIDNPIFGRQLMHPPIWYAPAQRLARATGLLFTLSGLACYAMVLVALYAKSLLVLLLPGLLGWALLVGLTLGPVIVEERQRQTWDTLRTIPLDIELIVVGKASGALWWMRHILQGMSSLLVLTAAGLGVISLILTPTALAENAVGGLPLWLSCLAVVGLPLGSAALFLADRAQHFVLTAVAALAVSASSRSVRGALAGAGALAVILWLLDMGGAMLVVVVLSGDTGPDLGRLGTYALFGPCVTCLTGLPLEKALVCTAGVLVVRESAVRGLWRWVVAAAVEA